MLANAMLANAVPASAVLANTEVLPMTAQRTILVPRMRSVWPLLLSVLLSTLIASSLVAAFAGFAATALPQAVSSELSSAPHKSIAISGAINAAQARTDRRAVRAAISQAFGGVPFTVARAVWSDPIGLRAAHGSKTVPIVQAATMTLLRPQVTMTSGTWPGAVSGKATAVIPAAVPASVAATLRLAAGQVLVLRDRQTGATVRFGVTGLYRPLDQAAPYWGLDLISPTGVSQQPGFITYGPFIVDQSAFSSGHLTIGGATWLYGLGTTRIAASQLGPLADRVSAALGHLVGSVDYGGLQATSGLPAVLRQVATKLVVARSLLLVGELELLLLAGAALTLTARTVASQREDESAIFGSRGAGRRQLLGMALTEALIVTFLAAAAGAPLGSRLAGLLASVGPLRTAGLHITGIPAGDWWTVGIVLLLCTAIMIWPALRTVSPGAAAVRRGRRATAAVAASAGADAALLVLAGLAGWQLREFSVLGRTPAGIGVDPVLAVAPAIALAAGTVLPLRLLPLLARAGDRLAARTRRFGGAMTSWELSRRATRQSAPMLLVLLAVGTSTLALAQHQSWRQSAFDQSAFTAGAEVRADTLLPATLATAGRIVHAPGVTSAMAVSTGLSAPGNGVVLAIESRRAPLSVLLPASESSQPPWRLMAAPPASRFITLPGHPVRLKIIANMAPGRGPSLGPISVTLAVMDAAGVIYEVPAGMMRADGRAHALIAPLTATGQAAYPLRLYAITAGYTLPLPARARHLSTDRVASFTVTGLATSAERNGPITGRLPASAVLASWIPSVTAPELAQLGTGTPPTIVANSGSSTQPVQFYTGDGFALDPTVYDSGTAPVDGEVTLRAVAPPNPIPAIATSAFMTGNGLSIGSDIQINDGPAAITVRIAGEIPLFPTVTAPGGALIVDESTAQELVTALGQPPLPVTEWWLATRKGEVPPGLPPATTVTDRDKIDAALVSDPMAAIPQQAIQATAIAAALLAVLGFSVAVAGSVRERRSQTALLAALGVDGRGQARLLCLEALALSLPAAATGLLLGTVLAHLLVPAVTLTATASSVPVLVEIPLATAVGIALIVTAIPVLAAATSAIYRPDPAAELRTMAA
jgi:hypothetical protein